MLPLGIAFILLGFSLVFLSMLAGKGEGAEAGGIILIGPIPIVFGTSQRSAFIAIILGFIMLILFLFFILYFRK